ncbi:MAG TPA: nucleoside-triphosphatase, partial [Chitinophagaceae bacterium]
MSERTNSVYYRLIALWVLCEAMLGGIIHGFKIPVSGLVVGSCAIICICLIAWYVPKKGSIIKATIIVAIFKMMLSPQAPPPAYIAVFFQGLSGELLFWNRKNFRLACILLAVLGLLESGLQRILMLTIVYGNDLWKAINNFINGLTKQKELTNYSLWIAGGYVALHLVTGLLIGWWASLLPQRVSHWSKTSDYFIPVNATNETIQPIQKKKRRKLKIGLFIVWLLLIGLYVQSYFKIGTPLLPSHISLKILLRSLIIVLGWIFIIGPLLTQLLHGWLKKKQSRSKEDIEQVLQLLPTTRALISQSWKLSSVFKGWKRINHFSRLVLVNSLAASNETNCPVYILSAPIQSGKTTSLIEWAAGKQNIHGILTPVVNGKRVFMNAETKEQWPMEAIGDEETILVGKFIFSKTGFQKAIQVIREAIDKKGWLIIDEIGPLELRGEGFHPVLKETLLHRHDNLLLVVREGLAEKTKAVFGINFATPMQPTGLMT